MNGGLLRHIYITNYQDTGLHSHAIPYIGRFSWVSVRLYVQCGPPPSRCGRWYFLRSYYFLSFLGNRIRLYGFHIGHTHAPRGAPSAFRSQRNLTAVTLSDLSGARLVRPA